MIADESEFIEKLADYVINESIENDTHYLYFGHSDKENLNMAFYDYYYKTRSEKYKQKLNIVMDKVLSEIGIRMSDNGYKLEQRKYLTDRAIQGDLFVSEHSNLFVNVEMKNLNDIHIQIIDEFGVHPNNYVVYRTFTGDVSDNIPGISGIGPKTIIKAFPELNDETEFTMEDLKSKCASKLQLNETRNYEKIAANYEILDKNYLLMNLKLLDISAQTTSVIRGIMQQPISTLNKMEFQRMFMEDKMWGVMKNLPEWLNNTWLSLNAFAMQTQK
jgi:hypothetical protein